MKKIIHIVVFLLSFGMLMSPAMGYVSNSIEKEIVADSCCSPTENSNSHENHSDESKDCQHDKNNCCGNNCPKSDCCLHLNVYQSVTFVLNSSESLEIPNGFNSSEHNDYYGSFHYKELIYSVWQPPKLIS